jgi:hypothetical protein
VADLGAANLGRAKLNRAGLGGAHLAGANLDGADLGGADLGGANLRGADLRKAYLAEANLGGADLGRADLTGAYLVGADLDSAELGWARLRGADLGGASLRGVYLVAADLCGAKLSRADLGGARLAEANLGGADLVLANLVDANLDGADLTGARLWEAQRGGWSIKGVICRHAFWDREGTEPSDYGGGEFERIFAEKPRIVLRYPGGMSPVDLLALPLVLERLQAEHPGSMLQVRSVQNDAGGASVTITVEDLEDRGTEAFAAEVEAVRGDLLAIQHRLRGEEGLRLAIEAKYEAVVRDVLPMLLERALPKKEFTIGHLAGPVIVEGPAMSRDTYNTGQAGAVGPGARTHDNTFQQVQDDIDLRGLAEELRRLREAMKSEATGTREQDKAVGAVADAEEAAAGGDGPAALRHLKSAGKWALGIAEKIGVAAATEALKRAM